MSTPTVDMSQLPKPAVIEQVDFETILNEWIERYKALDPDYQALNESDPVYKLLEVAAFREMVQRQRVNDGAHATMLAYAKGTDLDVRAVDYDVERLTITPADESTTPPTPAVMESDDAFRYRIQLSNRAKNTAGSEDDYRFWALSADGRVKNITATSQADSLTVTVTVLSHEGNGAASAALIQIVDTALTAKDKRPLSDEVVTQSATINEFDVTATLTIKAGPDAGEVKTAAEANLKAWLNEYQDLGIDITLDGFYAALRVPGVHRVQLASPSADIINTSSQAGFAKNITINTQAIA